MVNFGCIAVYVRCSVACVTTVTLTQSTASFLPGCNAGLQLHYSWNWRCLLNQCCIPHILFDGESFLTKHCILIGHDGHTHCLRQLQHKTFSSLRPFHISENFKGTSTSVGFHTTQCVGSLLFVSDVLEPQCDNACGKAQDRVCTDAACTSCRHSQSPMPNRTRSRLVGVALNTPWDDGSAFSGAIRSPKGWMRF